MNIDTFSPEKNVELSAKNTLAIPGRAQYFVRVNTETELEAAANWARNNKLPIFVLGGGSNILPKQVINGLVIQNAIQGIEIKEFMLEAGAGENWHQLVLESSKNQLYGIENLALIPGTVGAAPVQNIGAYGVELKDVFHSLDALDLHTGEWKNFQLIECQFGYRDSLFKRHPGRYCITKVRLTLSKVFTPNLEYGPLQAFTADKDLSSSKLIEAICQLRSSKLPDPNVIPNAGSFFKNPIVSATHHGQLKKQYPDLIAFSYGHDFKLAAGWLLDKAGFKGKMDTKTGVGMYQKQALVLVNPERADLDSIQVFVSQVRERVKELFQVELEIEPQLFG
jgi:UDP-N-acetylmuramate dehydrogenase